MLIHSRYLPARRAGTQSASRHERRQSDLIAIAQAFAYKDSTTTPPFTTTPCLLTSFRLELQLMSIHGDFPFFIEDSAELEVHERGSSRIHGYQHDMIH